MNAESSASRREPGCWPGSDHRQDMINLERDDIAILRHPAVFAARPSLLPDQRLKGRVHPQSVGLGRAASSGQGLSGFGFEDG